VAIEPYYTLVLGVDARHLWQLSRVWPTWRRHKPSLTRAPLVVFYDREDVTEGHVRAVIRRSATIVPWPPENVSYTADPALGKFGDARRAKMLAGFVYVAAAAVRTAYWLKLDTDVVAVERDNWIDTDWFDGRAAIIAHPWGYTKPPDQFVRLDRWVDAHRDDLGALAERPPLDLIPAPGAEALPHPRIISWCAFFDTGVTRYAADAAAQTVGQGQLPVPSQDGYLWYVTRRLGLGITTTNMKRRGWQHWSADKNVDRYARLALGGTDARV